MERTLEALRDRGWTVDVRDVVPLLSDAQRARYPSLPPRFLEVLGSIVECRSPGQQCWLYGPVAYGPIEAPAFRWNECELMSLESYADDADAAAGVRAFWDVHLPFMMAVHSDYDYLALRLGPKPAVVHGFAPAFEEPSVVSESFDAFLEQLRAAAAQTDPPWPFDVFLDDGAA